MNTLSSDAISHASSLPKFPNKGIGYVQWCMVMKAYLDARSLFFGGVIEGIYTPSSMNGKASDTDNNYNYKSNSTGDTTKSESTSSSSVQSSSSMIVSWKRKRN
jgi:hypothetical protein